MPEDHCNAYVAYRLACVRERIQETERLMRPPTPEELRRLQTVLQRLKEQEGLGSKNSNAPFPQR
jgi:hypothetical protein